MVIVRATEETEAGVPPSQDLLRRMGAYNEELAKAGVMLAGDGLKPSSAGARVQLQNGRSTVINGPFAETGQLIAGFWVWQVASLDEAIDWARRCPQPTPGRSELEIRPLYEAEDVEEEATADLRALEERRQAGKARG